MNYIQSRISTRNQARHNFFKSAKRPAPLLARRGGRKSRLKADPERCIAAYEVKLRLQMGKRLNWGNEKTLKPLFDKINPRG